MGQTRLIVLDVLKPHSPSILELAERLTTLPGGGGGGHHHLRDGPQGRERENHSPGGRPPVRGDSPGHHGRRRDGAQRGQGPGRPSHRGRGENAAGYRRPDALMAMRERIRAYIKKISAYNRISHSDEIGRRYFAMNAFDGILTTLGILFGSYAGNIREPHVVFITGMGAAVATGVSG